MKLGRSLSVLTAIVVIIFSIVAASAQTSPNLENGFKHWGSYDGGSLDTVNNLNGNMMLHAPLIPAYAQQGSVGVQYLLYQTSKTWQEGCKTQTINGSGQTVICYWTSQWPGVGLVQSPVLTIQRTLNKNGTGTGLISYYAFGYILTDENGATHQFVATSSTLDSTGEPIQYESIDTSGYRLTMSNPDSYGVMLTATITNRHGAQSVAVFPQQGGCGMMGSNMLPKVGPVAPVIDDAPLGDQFCSQSTLIQQITDNNGNLLNFYAALENSPSPQSQTAVFDTGIKTDTLGRSFPTLLGTPTTDYSGCVSSLSIVAASVQNYTAPDGSTQPLKFCYANVTPQTAFNITGISEVQAGQNPQPVSGLQLVTAVLADGTKWTFSYDSYEEVTSIGLPTGGSISYTWATITFPSCSQFDGGVSWAITSRTVNDNNGHSNTWNYSWGTVVNHVISNTVTDPLGNDTVHTFTAIDNQCAFYETRTQSYQGTGTSRQLLRQVDTAFSSTSYQTSTGDGVALGDVEPTSITTTIYPSGKVSQVTKTYAPAPASGQPISGNVATEKEYDWGAGTPGALLKETDTTYQWQNNSAYLTAHLLDLPASVIVKDGNGIRVAETDYVYDEPQYLTTSGISTQHVSAPATVRGNPTTVKRWLSTSNSFVVTHTNWYDTGEVYQETDALGNTTTHSYATAYAGAYPTQSCNPLTQCVNATYDFNTGVITSFTDANSQTSNFAYDFLWRLTSAQAPPDPTNSSARAQTTFAYSAANTFPLSITRQKSITNTLNDSATNYFDGLARGYQGQHVTPAGTVTVNTNFDGLGHVASVSNPYYSTSDPTYGVTSTQYDGLGRVTQTTRQDGSIATVSYSDNCTTTTDEAGKQRRSCTNAAGWLIEVDEPGDTFAGTSSSGAFTVNGTLQSKSGVGAAGAATASGSVSIAGMNHSIPGSPGTCDPGIVCDGSPNPPLFDTGKVYITMNGHEYDYFFGGGGNSPDTPSSVAGGLAAAIQADSARLVNASVASNGTTVTLTARSAGSAGNIPFSTGYTYDTADFPSSGPSFTASPASGALSGGTNSNPGVTVYDTGTVTATVGGFTASAPYSQSGNSTASQVASALASALNAASSPVTASASGATVSLTYKTAGTAGNTAVTVSSSSTQTQWSFSPPSFSSPGTTLTGGQNQEGISLDHNYFVTLYTYDALGNLLNVTQKGDPSVTTASQWRVRNFTYDSLSRLLTANNPESGAISYSYDANGNVLQKTSPAPNQTSTATQVISYCYDALNRVTGKAYSAQSCTSGQLPSGSAAVSYTYDSGPNGIGHLTSLIDQAGSGSYSYDVLGRISTETRVIAGVSKNLSYAYNLDGSLKSVTYPSSATVTYTPDSAGRILSAVDTGNSINYVTGATYGVGGALTGFVSGNSSSFAGITSSFSFNKRLQPVNMSASSPGQTIFSIGYDFHVGNGTSGADNGNVWGITNNKDTSRNQTFTYDPLNRLISAQNAGTDCTKTTLNGKTGYWGNSYIYDAWGNLLSKTPTKCSAENITLTAAASNQLQGYGYDAAGNMTHDLTSGKDYTYDQENRITAAAGFTYTYDADGNRVEKSNGTTGTLYWYMTPGIVAESDLAGNLQSEYVFFAGERVARKDFPSGNVAYYFSDNLKTASVITDATGNIKSESDYYPWGGELQFANSDSNHYKFTGKERDSETGLDYFGARYYGNALGRFITPDWSAKPVPIPYADLTDPQSFNQYSYVRNIPTVKVDADGHQVVLTGDDKDKQEEQKRIVANASKKGEAALFKTETGKDGKTKLVLDKKAAADFKGQHSKGFNLLVQTIDAKNTATVVLDDHDSRTRLDGNGNATVFLDRNVAGIDIVAPMRDSKGNVIPNPFNIIAGHELLGHARLHLLGDPGARLDGSGSKTFQIENQLRKEQGIPLRPDDVP